MKQILLLVFIIISCQKKTSISVNSSISDLGHIDVVLDSATWNAIKNDSFMQKEFGVLDSDTAYYWGKPSYDLYVLGQLNFLHLSLAKAFWDNKQGSGVLVFQTQRPEQSDSLYKSWKYFYNDSLFVHTYKGSDFKLDEVMAWYKYDTTKPKEARIFANLTTYSSEAYKNWGITDSIVNSGLAMKQFMLDWGGEELETKLFHSITELYMTINQQEYKEIKSALLAVGYVENRNTFTHIANPPIYISISEENTKSKYSKVKVKLNHTISEKEIVFSPLAKLMLSGDEGWFIFN